MYNIFLIIKVIYVFYFFKNVYIKILENYSEGFFFLIEKWGIGYSNSFENFVVFFMLRD